MSRIEWSGGDVLRREGGGLWRVNFISDSISPPNMDKHQIICISVANFAHISKLMQILPADANSILHTSHVETRAKSDLNKQEYLLFDVNCQKLTI